MNKDTKKDKIFSPDFNNDAIKILTAMTDFVRVLDSNGNVIFQNDSMREFISLVPKISESDWNDEGISGLTMHSFKTAKPSSAELCISDKVFSLKCSPIIENGEVVAVIEVYRDITLENNEAVGLYETNKKLQQDMLLAKSIQTQMLPKLTDFGGIHFDTCYIPSEQLSGDFFDLIPLGDGKVALYISDVVGHGVSASILTMFIRQTVRNILEEEHAYEPFQLLDRMLLSFREIALEDSQYFSMFYAVIDTKAGTISYGNAGHNCEPMVLRNGKVKKLKATGILISSLFDSYVYKQHTMALENGDKFLFYTDGIIEAENSMGEEYGIERFEKSFLDADEEVIPSILKQFGKHINKGQSDDIALLLVDINKIR